MGQIQQITIETRVVGICNGRMVARRPGTADSRLEPNRKKSDGRNGILFGNFRPS